jgi:hypothetical protein
MAQAAGALNGLNEMDCDDFAEVAAELALGGLTGRERAQAIMHLDSCDTCRVHVRDRNDFPLWRPPGMGLHERRCRGR